MNPLKFYATLLLCYTTVLATAQTITASITPDQTTVCSGSTVQFTLSVSGGIAPYTLVYNDGTTDQTFSGASDGATFNTDPLVGTTTFTLVSITDAVGTGNALTGSQTINVNPTPTATVTNPTGDICEGTGAINLQISLTGTPPFSLTPLFNGVPQTPLTGQPATISYPVNPTDTILVSVTDITDGSGCINSTLSAAAAVNVIDNPVATLSPDTTICAGQSVQLQFVIEGDDDFYDVVYTDGTSNFTLSAIPERDSVEVTPTATSTTYTIVSVQNSTTVPSCASTATSSATVTTLPQPTAVLSGDASTCPGDSTTLTVTFSGTAPFTFEYRANGFLQPAVTTADNPYTFNVAPLNTTTYELDNLQDANCNDGVVNGMPTVTLFPVGGVQLSLPTGGGTNTEQICEGETRNLQFNFTGGTAPFTIYLAQNGVQTDVLTTSDNPFILPVSPSDSVVYTIDSLEDINGCTGTATGQATLDVYSSPTLSVTTMDAVICAGEQAMLEFTITGDDPNGLYDIVYSDGINTSVLTAVSDGESIGFQPTQSTTYNFTTIEQASTFPDCEVALTGVAVTVTVNPQPTVEFTGTYQVCPGDTADIIVNFSGTAPFTFTYFQNGNPQPSITTSDNPYILQVAPIGFTNYVPESVVDANCTNGGVSGSATVTNFPVPTATLSGDATICEGESTDLSFSFTGTGPFTVEYQRSNGATIIDTLSATATTNTLAVPVLPTDSTQYVIVSVTDANCAGNFSGSASVNVISNPVLATSGDTTVCAGEPATIYFDVEGDDTQYIVTYTNDGGATTPTELINAVDSLVVTPTADEVYTILTIENATLATSTVSGAACSSAVDSVIAITVLPQPTAVISGDATICAGESANIAVTLTGTAPFLLEYTPDGGATVITETATSSMYTFEVTPTVGTTYELISLTDANCSQGQISGSSTITVNPTPTATFGADATICEGEETLLDITFTGNGPFSISYTDGDLTFFESDLNATDNIPVTPEGTTTYTILTVSDAGGCTGSGGDAITISTDPTPTAENVVETCGANSTYVVTFDIVGGTPPYQALGSVGGVVVGNTFTSNPIPSGLAYEFVYSDANNCGNVGVSGVKNCDCVTDAGTMSDELLEVCGANAAMAMPNGDQVDDGDDAIQFVLHDEAGTVLGNVLGINSVPSFGYTSQLDYGTTYYISLVIGNDDGAGTVDFSDPCFDVAPGQPVVFYPTPMATLSGTQAVCAGDTFALTLDIVGNGPFMVSYTDGTQVYNLTNITDGFQVALPAPAENTTYTLLSVSDDSETMCEGTVSGMAMVTIEGMPEVVNLAQACNNALTAYTVTFDIVGGATGNFTVSGGAGTLDANGTFTSAEIPNGTAYSFTVTDGSGCEGTTISGTDDCSCVTDAGTVGTTLIEVCEDQLATATANADETLEADDVLVFALHDNSGTTVGNVFATSATPEFGFQAGLEYGTTYYISPVAANDDGTGAPDLSDPCLSVGFGQPVVFYQNPIVTLSADSPACEEDGVDLTFDIAGSGIAYDVVYTDGTFDYTLSGINDGYVATVSPDTTITYSIVSVTDVTTGCTGDATTVADVTIVVSPPQVEDVFEVCSADNTTYTVQFSISSGDAATYAVTGTAGGGTITGGMFTSNPIPSGTQYEFEVTDGNGCTPVVVEGFKDCNCTTDAGTMDDMMLALCEGDTAVAMANFDALLDADDVLIYALHTSGADTLGTVLGTSFFPEFAYADSLDFGVTYYISAVAGNNDGMGGVDLTDPCLSIAPGQPVTWSPLPTATFSGGGIFCEGEQFDLIFGLTGDATFDVVYTDGTQDFVLSNISDGHIETLTATNSTSYTLVSVEDSNNPACQGTVSGFVNVIVNDVPDVENIATACNNPGTFYTVSFDITGGDAASYNVSGGAGTLAGSTFTSDPIASGASYTFVVTDGNNCDPVVINGTEDCNCVTDAGTVPNATIEVCSDQTVTVTTNGDETLEVDDVLSYILHDNPGTAAGNILDQNATGDFTYNPALGIQPDVTYYISSVAASALPDGSPDFTDPCLSVSAGQPVVFNEVPLATLNALDVVCRGEGVELVFSLNGNGPFDVVYNNGESDVTLSNINNGFTATVFPESNTTYTLVSVTDDSNPACVADLTNAQAQVVTISAPDTVNYSFDCDQTTQLVTISFELVGGDTSNYQVFGSPGTLVGNVFTSDPIVIGDNYSFSIQDGSGCDPIEIEGLADCPCGNDAGTLDPTLIEVCENETATATHNADEVLLPGDLLQFALHNGNPISFGDTLQVNDTPDFTYDPATMQYGVVYYISAIAGPDADGNGTVDIDDICFTFSEGTPVIFYEAPTAAILGDTMVCPGDEVPLTFSLTGVGPFEVEYTDGTTNFTLSGIDSGFVEVVTINAAATYAIVNVSDAQMPACMTMMGTDSAEVTLIESPMVVEEEPACNDDNTTFQIVLNITGGDVATYQVDGTPGTLVGGTFTSDPLPNGATYTFEVYDAMSCDTTTITGTFDCTCFTDAGTMASTTEQAFCEDELALVGYNNDATLDPDDLVQFVLHDGPQDTIGNILAISDNPEFGLLAGMTTGTTYFITAVAGQDDGTGNVDLTDRCLSVAFGTPIVFEEQGTASLSSSQAICVGTSTDLVLSFVGGTGPFDVVYSDGINQFTVSGAANGQTITVAPTVNTTFTLVAVTDQNGACDLEITGDPVVVTVNDVQASATVTSDFDGFGVSCFGGADGSASASATGSNSTPYDYAWSSGDFGAEVDGLAAGTYTVTVTDLVGCTDTAQVIITEPTQITATFDSESPTCFGDFDGELSINDVTGGSGDYTYSIDGTFFTGDSIFTSLEAGTYEVSVQDGNGCIITEDVVVQQADELIIDLGADTSITLGNTVTLEAFTNYPDLDLLDTATLLWDPLETLVIDSNDILTAVATPLENTFYTITLLDTFGCSASDTIFVQVITEPRVYIPTGFSPNNDGQNDLFLVFGGNDVEIIEEFRVFDRWGEEVHAAEMFAPNDPTFGWDGTLKGERLMPAVFVYFATVRFIDGSVKTFRGDVTLIR